MEGDKRFRELIDRSFVEEVSEGERQLIHDHIRDCDGCKRDRKSTRLNSSHLKLSRMPSSA